MSKWDEYGFHHFGGSNGTLRIDMMGDEMEVPFRARFFIDKRGEIGGACAEMPDGEKWLFLSRAETGDVYTQSGKRDGEMEVKKFPKELTRLVTTTKTDREGVLIAHIIACGAGVKSDTDGLKRDIARAPQKAADLAVEAMKQLAGGFR